MYDFIVVGSGVSGGRIAFELANGGAKVLLVEAGHAYNRKTFPKNEMDYSSRMFWGGGIEVTTDGRMGLLRAKCVGGTSIVNQALLDEFDDLAWDDWRSRSGVAYFTSAEFSSHYTAIREGLPISEIPRQFWNKNTEKFIGAFDQKKFGWKPLQRAQTDCALDKGSDCIVCLGGCPRGAKQSSLETTIKWALFKGIDLISDYEVEDILVSKHEVMIRGFRESKALDFFGAKLVLAAGALGNTGILFRSGFGDKLPALGHDFACHPQYMSYGFYNETIDAHKGAFQAVKSADPHLRKLGLKFENVFAPPIGTAMLFSGFGKKHNSLMQQYRSLTSMEVAIRDDNAGKIMMHGKKLIVHKALTEADKQKMKIGLDTVKSLFMGNGAKEVVACKQGFGLHLMGGCVMGVDSAKSVVGPDFKVHGFYNVFAADSSVFPSAPGINPSLTIMALSRMAALKMLEES